MTESGVTVLESEGAAPGDCLATTSLRSRALVVHLENFGSLKLYTEE